MCFSMLTFLASAQEAQIVSIEGTVYVKENASSKWEKAVKGQFLKADAEIKTANNGKCIVTFNKDRNSSITIRNKTNVKIEEILPGSVFLSKGRVFTLIRNLEKVGDFKVKTPTAITGARGTGWMTEFENGITSVSVFEDNVSVAGLDKNGEILSQTNVGEDFHTSIPPNGELSQIEPVSETGKQEWRAEVNTLEKIREEFSEGAAGTPGTLAGAILGQPGPMGPQEIQLMIGKMKESGRYSDQEIQEMKQMMKQGFEQMNPDQMSKMMEVMQEVGGSSPEEKAMMQEAMSHKDEIIAMTPEQREDFFHQLETQHGITRDFSSDEASTGHNGFDQYMQSQNQPNQDSYGSTAGDYNYSGDTYFGGFDQQWDWQGSQYVQDPYYQNQHEQYTTITDRPTCVCPSGYDCSTYYQYCTQ